MNTAALINFPKPSLTTGVNVNIQKGEDGYTPLPNFICDEGYLAVLSGDAIKCLVFLNRHINGFHIAEKAMGEILVMKITGIKDKRTVRKYMAELANYKLVEIQKENGKSNIYSVTFSNRTPVKPVASHVIGSDESKNTQPVTPHVPSTSNAVTFHATAPVTPHVPTTSDMPCHSVKETYLKENIKNKKKNLPVDNFDSDIFSNSIEYHREDQKLYTFRELANVYTIKSDFTNQAKTLNSKLTDELILADLKNFAQWTTTREKTTAQGWMNYWIYRIQKSSQPKTKTTPSTPKQPPVRKKMTDAQINMFSKKLCNHDDFASTYSNVGETQKQFEGRIALDLRDQNKVKAWSSYLHDVGFAGSLEDFA